MRFNTKIALVTGAGSGIGRATSLQLAREGAKVAVVDIDREAGCATVSLIEKAGGEAIYLNADIAQTAQVQGAIARLIEVWGRVDILVNNAGVMRFSPVVALEEADWDAVLGINLRAAFLFCKYALPHMKGTDGRKGGAVVNISSVHAQATTRHVAAYAASKGGLEAFTRALSIESEALNVRVNAVAPGAVDTPLLWTNPNLQSGAEKLEGAVASSESVSQAICFLASDEAQFISGTVLSVDAGRLARL
ncbi:NAD(P)-dependent dehydrogenase, short-chain alcohol dehydrogenase family [Abditibacterium utsteinense]|uniref:NAD(P)-dependent dehydrogenase, short-chain alcohol dehydrogenase family n=1 Tax=Abditibacterium utsteinense TaxID=1960156 RepID=A0A2S8SWQ7_9BACT|nr:SDR family NAD(P)-dependent oxidoreductase [Abditibacterium utsteinense]PQV65217.1 NAD(P)-dependent dehydrogenase, short-chain alcohol dehydrogenase family [Abditibacterium utsteinense]